ncbi:major facilitator superfamily transporter MFS_1 [Thecamonas trahens ATCC 50062]|uniref:Major facilitator superfamily transporter MFS_1 n=1 Tax=Thecamonas trahens ATCC 50062 TaxID=461836 RepID=A0A0L0DUR4_THETB|nr:major facilitator superfamily transporter MFS_1 [Thecamonas trahens ATCC 50062]KNC55942.1 major facilitator superfamily transporter MFS_1 [Thecamonas trahens ATCC 50062]|eukprot:XP_013752714.1 major facilitator superfamily transporter MFS_1 [Thecamonas trahens ATCC 50062]
MEGPRERAPDKGYAWVVVFASFVIHVVVLGFIYSFGVLFVPIEASFAGASKASVALVGSTANAFLTLFGIVAGRVIDAFGFRIPSVVAGLIGVAALLVSSVATSIWMLLATYGVVFGTALGMAYFPAIVSVSTWFQARRGTGLGLAVCGSGVGNLAFAPLLSELESAYGWRVALRVMALSMVVLVAAAMLLARRVPPAKARIGLSFVALLGDRVFVSLLAVSATLSYSILVLFIHIVPSAQESGVSKSRAALILAAMGVASIAGRLVNGFTADCLGVPLMLRVAAAGMAVCLAVWPFVSGFWPFLLLGFAYAYNAGSYIGLAPAFVAELYPIQSIPTITGFTIGFSFVGIASGSPVTGLLRDATGSYHVGAFIAAAASLLSIVFITLAVRFHAAKVATSADLGTDSDGSNLSDQSASSYDAQAGETDDTSGDRVAFNP